MSSSSTDRKSFPHVEGKRLGRYQILGHVASGGMATVHVARAEGTFGFERWVAVKVLHPHLATEDELVTMFVDEARMAARIRHPKVVSVLDVADDPEAGLYLVMDYVEGDHLGAILSGLGQAGCAMPTRVAVRIVLDLLEGLEAAHELEDDRGEPTPIIHRDVTPHNLLVGVDGVTRLSDFGIARAEARITQTREGQFKGKLAYMAPEQLQSGVASAQSDIFSAAIVLFECLTTKRMFRGDTTADTLRKLLYEPIPPLDRDRPDLSLLAPVVARSLSRDPSERFASAREMAEALEAAASASTGIAQPREVGDVVRRARGDVLAERAARFRLAAELIGKGAEVTVTSRGRPIESGFPMALTTSSPPPLPVHLPRDTRRHAPVRIAVIAALSLAVTFAGLVYFRGSTVESDAAGVRNDGAGAELDDRPAELVRGFTPIVPSGDVSLSPTVLTRLRIGTDGRVLAASIVNPRADLEAFEKVALSAARGYGFRPAMRGGRPIESSIDHPVRFTRYEGPEHVVRIKGSDTIGGALAPALAEAFRTPRPDIRVEIEALGSSTAFVGLFDGSAELGASSRPIKASELEEARRLGLVLEETVIGYDGIAIVVHPDNPMRSITIAELAALFAGRISDFATIGAPRGRPHLVGRPSYSGTHGFFEDHVLEPQHLTFAQSVNDLEHSDAIIELVASDVLAVAYVGAGYVNGNVRVVPVVATAGGAPVFPNEGTIRNGSYPIVRPLLAYSRGTPTGAAAEFLRFVLSPAGRTVVQAHGFVPSEVALAGAQQGATTVAAARRLERIVFAMGNTRFPPEAETAMQHILADIGADSHARVVVTGHADREGTETENVRLGLARATVVRDVLVQRGIAATRIVVQSRGSSAPVATNDTEQGRSANRRADVLVLH